MKRLTPHAQHRAIGWFFIASLVAFAAGALSTFAAHAQTQNFFPPPNTLLPPFDYPPVLGTTPVQVLALDPARRRIIFFNPSATATIAFCPSQITRAGATFACAVNGPGSITLRPYGSYVLDGGTPQGPPLSMGAAWFGAASAANIPATVFEFE
jgi:hypothetical protein